MEIFSRFSLVTWDFEQKKKVIRSYWNLFHFDSHLTSTSSWCEDDKMRNSHNELFFSSPLSFFGWFRSKSYYYWWKRFSCNLLKCEGRPNPRLGKNVVATIHNASDRFRSFDSIYNNEESMWFMISLFLRKSRIQFPLLKTGKEKRKVPLFSFAFLSFHLHLHEAYTTTTTTTKATDENINNNFLLNVNFHRNVS